MGADGGRRRPVPSVPELGAAEVEGSLVFGIGTRPNNSLGNATVLTVDPFGNLTTVFDGVPYADSYLDSGTNGIYFLDAATTGIQPCADSSDFYCPTSPLSLTATNLGFNGASATASFRLLSADRLFQTPNVAFSDLGGPRTTGFAWGLAFFYDRIVFTAIEEQATPAGSGPFFAY